MFKCLNCGEVFSEEELSTYKEHHGDGYYERISCCPHCESSEFSKAIECPICREWFAEDENSYTEACDGCVEEQKFAYRYDAKKCFDLSKSENQEIELNAFLVSQFSREEIENILLNELNWEQRTPYSDYIDFIESNEWWFVEQVAKKER